MWPLVAATVCVATFWLLLRQLRHLPDFPTQVLLVAIWLRYALQAFPNQTLSSVAGFSVNALFSIATVGFFVMCMDWRFMRLRYMGPIYVLTFFVIISGLFNQTFIGLARDLAKWFYFLGILALAYRDILIFGVQKFLYGFLFILINPLMLQFMSILLDNPKVEDGATSYIGGWHHEAPFSTVPFLFIALVVIMRWKNKTVEFMLIVLGIFGILFANYRTTILASAPLSLISFLIILSEPWGSRFRPAVMTVFLIFGFALAPVVWNLIPERYEGVSEVVSNPKIFLKDSLHLTQEERQIFSGRVGLWTQYFDAYADGNLLNKLIGFGPQAWESEMRLYAHNGFVAYLYDFGAIGLIAFTYMLFRNLYLTLRIPDRQYMIRLAAAQLGFIILNIAAMPLWSNEGLIIYAILLACSWALQPVRATANITGPVQAGAPRVN